MKRKIIKQASQAYTITLPIDWVRNNNLDEKSEVNVDVVEKSLIISHDKRILGERVKINVSGLNERNIIRHISALYAKGADEIEIESDKDISQIIINRINQHMGYAIISQDKNKTVIKDVSGTPQSDLDEIFKRVFQMILSFYDSAKNDIFGKESETIESLKSRDMEINKFCLYLQRAVNKMSYSDPLNGRVLFAYSFEIEKIGDEIERLWRTNIKYDVKKTPYLKKVLDLVGECLNLAFDFYYQTNPKISEKMYELREEVREMAMEKPKTNEFTARLMRHATKIAEEAADLNHLTLIRRL